jgi:putative component of toxin-antitoxin plasmid stabilization module
MLPSKPVEVLEYLEPNGRSPYGEWFENLNPLAAAKVVIAVTRMALGNFSNAKSVGAVFMNTRSISDRVIESILAGMAIA